MVRMNIRPILAAGVLTALLLTAGAAAAATTGLTAALSGAAEVPPNDSPGTGSVTGIYDSATMKFTYTITYSGLSGPVTGAHFHGPAAAGANGPHTLEIADNTLGPRINGMAKLTAAQAADLVAGKWYLNLHTAKFKGGELRGQLMAK